MAAPDTAHTFQVTYGVTDVTALVRSGSLQWRTRADGEVSDAGFTLDDRAGALGDLDEWQEVAIVIDAGEAGEETVFGGWAVKLTPSPDETGQWLSWEVDCDGWESLCGRTPKLSKTWLGATFKVILGELFTLAGISGFDVTTYVATGPTLDVFSVSEQTLAAGLADLATRAGMRYWVDGLKAVHAEDEDASALNAPFEVVAPGTLADYGAGKYDVLKLTRKKDASALINRLTIVGGTTLGDPITDTLYGVDKVGTDIGWAFGLSSQNIRTTVDVTLNGVSQVAGTAWVDYFGKTLDNGSVVAVLVSRLNGVVYFPTGHTFADADEIVATYRVETAATLVLDASNSAASAASYARYGQYFDGRLEGLAVSDEAEMAALGEAYLGENALAVISGEFDVLRYGMRGGQRVTITSMRDALSGYYQVRQVQNRVLESRYVRATVTWGNKRRTLTEVMNRWRGETAVAPAMGDLGVVNLTGVLTVLTSGTQFTAP